MNKLWGHFYTITRHKIIVLKTCFKAGLYKQGLLHDLSKYSFIEFGRGVKYYQGGKRSPINKEKEVNGYALGWLHHKGRNRHHFEYWIDYKPNPHEGIMGVKMPKKYVAEMVIDRISASKNYLNGNYKEDEPLKYWLKGKDFYIIDEDSKKLTEYLLIMLRDKGEKELLHFIKHTLMTEKNKDYKFDGDKLGL